MIRYALACAAGHLFESWFRDSSAYDDQIARELVSCPACRSNQVAKTIMAPAILGEQRRSLPRADTPSTHPIRSEPALGGRDMRTRLNELRNKIISEGQDVGARFPEEARRMHDGDRPAGQIYGQASMAEARDLLEEGILVLPLPSVPDELN